MKKIKNYFKDYNDLNKQKKELEKGFWKKHKLGTCIVSFIVLVLNVVDFGYLYHLCSKR